MRVYTRLYWEEKDRHVYLILHKEGEHNNEDAQWLCYSMDPAEAERLWMWIVAAARPGNPFEFSLDIDSNNRITLASSNLEPHEKDLVTELIQNTLADPELYSLVSEL